MITNTYFWAVEVKQSGPNLMAFMELFHCAKVWHLVVFGQPCAVHRLSYEVLKIYLYLAESNANTLTSVLSLQSLVLSYYLIPCNLNAMLKINSSLAVLKQMYIYIYICIYFHIYIWSTWEVLKLNMWLKAIILTLDWK